MSFLTKHDLRFPFFAVICLLSLSLSTCNQYHQPKIKPAIELSIPANGIVVFPFGNYTAIAFRTNLFSINGKEKRIELESGEYMTIKP